MVSTGANKEICLLALHTQLWGFRLEKTSVSLWNPCWGHRWWGRGTLGAVVL